MAKNNLTCLKAHLTVRIAADAAVGVTVVHDVSLVLQ